MIVKYVNSMGRSVNLNQNPYKMLISDILDYKPDIIENDGKILGFDNDIIVQKEINIDIHRTSSDSARIAMNKLTDHFNVDVIASVPGRLYIDDWYMNCYIYAREAGRWETDRIISCCYKVISDTLSWTTEKHLEFLPQTSQSTGEDLKTYPYAYSYTYPDEPQPQYIDNDHYDTADFQMIVFGERSRTYITIGDHLYHVEYPIEKGEYMVIDSRDTAKTGERVYLARNNGERVNLFDYRDPNQSIFARIPAGKSIIDVDGAGVNITLYQKRSEPKWK